MKRDMDLIRMLLLDQESGERSPGLSRYSDKEILYNMSLLIEAGLVRGHVNRDGDGELFNGILTGLTWDGHDFLDAARDPTLWEKAKKHVIKPGTSFTFDLLKEWLKSEIRRVIG